MSSWTNMERPVTQRAMSSEETREWAARQQQEAEQMAAETTGEEREMWERRAEQMRQAQA